MVDSDRAARDVAARNMPDVPFMVADIHTLSGADLRSRAQLGPGERVHVVIGGPPCQGLSGLARRALRDERNLEIIDFLRLVRELRPLVALMENVPQTITSHEGQVVREVCDTLAESGYSCCADVLNASEFGVPQFRRRAFVLAYRGDLSAIPEFPIRTHEAVPSAIELMTGNKRVHYEKTKLPYVSVSDAIGDLPPLRAGEGEEIAFYSTDPSTTYQQWARRDSIAIFNHRARAHARSFLDKIGVIGEGSRNMELPEHVRFSNNYFSQAYARLHREGLAFTITTHFSNPGSGRFLHYRDLRSITVREAARLQSFPDWFVFDGDLSTQMRHVGNAVPPLLAAALARHVERDVFSDVLQNRSSGHVRGLPVERHESSEERSRIMRAVTSKNSGAELMLRRALWAIGLRGYRLHSDRLPGRPDVIFGPARVAVFVDGCFWHGCRRCYRAPKSNQEYWRLKVDRNKRRDRLTNRKLKSLGWHVIRVWEHDVLRRASDCAREIRRKVAKVRRHGNGRPTFQRVQLRSRRGAAPRRKR